MNNESGIMDEDKKCIKLDVPYYSQFTDVKDPYWMPRACGVVCLGMVFAYHTGRDVDIDDLIKKGNESGAYGPHGWYHDGLVALAKDEGLDAHREEGMKDSEKLIQSLRDGNPVIVSAVKFILGQKKFHMVVLARAALAAIGAFVLAIT